MDENVRKMVKYFLLRKGVRVKVRFGGWNGKTGVIRKLGRNWVFVDFDTPIKLSPSSNLIGASFSKDEIEVISDGEREDKDNNSS